MVRLTRAQQQERTRAAVLAAGRAEFAERGYVDAKVDQIAERAELTRGAVYSNFPSKRALYLAVLIDSIDPPEPARAKPTDAAEALGAFVRVRFERLPLSGQQPAGGKLQLRSLDGVVDDDAGRATLAQVARLEALLLAVPLESQTHERRVRLAELVLTLLSGAGHLAEAAPGFGDPFDVARAGQHLASLDLADTWDPPHLAFAPRAHLVDDPWQPPSDAKDLLTGQPARLEAGGVIAVLGTSRLGAAEEAVRAANPDAQIIVAVVTSDPAELGRIVELRIGDHAGCLRRVFGPDPWPRLRLVLDDRFAHALGIPDPDDDTEVAVRIGEGKLVARAEGRGAAHAVSAVQWRGIPNVASRSS